MSSAIGGFANYASGDYSAMLGSSQGQAPAVAGTVVAGAFNTAGADYSSVTGGCSNATEAIAPMSTPTAQTATSSPTTSRRSAEE